MKAFDLTWNELEQLSTELPVIIPIGSFEQHGTHIPLGSDSIVAENLALEVSKRYKSIVMPTVTYGNTFKYSKWPGTIGVSAQTLINMLTDIGRNLINNGYKNIVFLNAHDENHEPAIITAQILGREYNIATLVIEWAQVAKKEFGQIKESKKEMHAGEGMTSLLMYWQNDILNGREVIDDYPKATEMLEEDVFKQGNRAHLIRSLEISEVPSGTCGSPSMASIEKGKQIEEVVVNNICKLLRELEEQNNEK